jgi:uncharacterized membrane protein
MELSMNEAGNRGMSLLSGLGLGAGLMFFLDPVRGRRRRTWIRDKAVHLGSDSRRALDKTWRDLRHRASGVAAEAKSAMQRESDVPDAVLQERIRSKLGRLVSHPGSIDVRVAGGKVTLHGSILAAEQEDLVDFVSSMRGVEHVENRLEPHEQADETLGLQGGTGRRKGPRSEFMQENWTPALRFLAGTAGGALALYGLSRGGPAGSAAGITGLGLLARGATNLEFKRLLGLRGRRGIEIQKTIHIDAPVEEVYRFWSNFENLPRIMGHLREVRDLGGGRTRWRVAGPAGVSVEWNAVITEHDPNRKIAWKSEAGSLVRSAGIVKFEPKRDGTRLDIRLSYHPPGGALGHAIAALFGADPKRAMDEDLVRFKSLMEEGKTTAHGETVTRQQVA